MSWFLTNTIAACLLPPLNLLVIGGIGLMLWKRRPAVARLLTALSLSGLWLLSTPWVAESSLHLLETRHPALNFSALPEAEAIVVLGGGTYFNAPEYGGDTVSRESWLRLRYAAALYRRTGKPILVSGGAPVGNSTTEAAQMRQVLEQELHVPVRWIEDRSSNTYENAQFSRAILQQADIQRIYLVTHAKHMPRAADIFVSTGLSVVAAPTAFTTRYRTDLLAFLPRAESLLDSKQFLHELFGVLWYKAKSGARTPKNTLEKTS